MAATKNRAPNRTAIVANPGCCISLSVRNGLDFARIRRKYGYKVPKIMQAALSPRSAVQPEESPAFCPLLFPENWQREGEISVVWWIMKFRIEGFAKEFPDGFVRESDTAIGALAAFHEVADACGDAQVFCGERSIMLSKLHDLADQEKQAAGNKKS